MTGTRSGVPLRGSCLVCTSCTRHVLACGTTGPIYEIAGKRPGAASRRIRQVRPLNGDLPREENPPRPHSDHFKRIFRGPSLQVATETDRYHPDALLLRRIYTLVYRELASSPRRARCTLRFRCGHDRLDYAGMVDFTPARPGSARRWLQTQPTHRPPRDVRAGRRGQ